jgi:uncharacterized protein YdhG (YjbR/CyaY superfamily)
MSADRDAVDAYVAALPPDARQELEAVRARILVTMPLATEGLSYGIPTFRLDGRYLVYLAAWKAHLSLYPVPRGDAVLDADLAPYRSGRGTLRFPLGTAIPEGLVERIVHALAQEQGATDRQSRQARE